MAQYNAISEIDLISRETLAHMTDALIIKPLCAVDATAEYYQQPNGWKVGDTIRFQVDPVYTAVEFDSIASDNTWVRDDTKVIAPQDIRSSTRTMYIQKHYDISVTLSAREKAMSFTDLSRNVLRPAGKELARKADSFLGNAILGAAGLYASTTVMSTAADMALARKAANYQQLNDDRFCLVNPDLEAQLLGYDWFNRFDSRGDSGYNGMIRDTMGMKFFSSQNFPVSTHTNSSGTTTTAASPSTTQNKVGTSNLIVAAVTSGFSANDRIMVAGCRRPLIVASNVSAGATTIPLKDPITEIIPASAAVTVVGGDAKVLTYKGCIFDSQSLAVAMPMLDEASGLPSSVVAQDGVSIRVVQGYNMTTKVTTLSMDFLIGAFALDPRRMTLLADAA